MEPCPDHLRAYPWYLPHQAWLGADARHDPEEAVPARANLAHIDLHGARLSGACLRRVDCTDACLRRVDFDDADLTAADMLGVVLYGVDLRGARLPDGRPWEVYAADPLALLVPDPDAWARAVAAWDHHDWGTCPLSAAYGWRSFDDVPAATYHDAVTFVAVFDGLLLRQPSARPSATGR